MNKKLTRTALIIRLELARLFGYRQHQNKSLILRCSRKHFAQLAEVDVRHVSNAYAELTAGRIRHLPAATHGKRGEISDQRHQARLGVVRYDPSRGRRASGAVPNIRPRSV